MCLVVRLIVLLVVYIFFLWLFFFWVSFKISLSFLRLHFVEQLSFVNCKEWPLRACLCFIIQIGIYLAFHSS